MRSTISAGCSTAPGSNRDQLPGDNSAKRSAGAGYAQASPVSQVPSHVSKPVVRRTDLFSLQDLEHMAGRYTAWIPSFHPPMIYPTGGKWAPVAHCPEGLGRDA